MSKQFWAILAVIAIVIIGIFYTTNKHNAPTAATAPTNNVEGGGSTGVKLVEYGDFQCIYCTQYFPIVKQVVADYSTQITFQFRNLPLTSLHPNAFAGARAAEAAALQGKFWQMHDLLYEQSGLYYNDNDQTWDTASNPEANFIQYAQQLGLNVSEFKQDYGSQKVDNMINADATAFAKTGAEEATPSFFLDGKQIQPTETVASFQQYINAAIAQKTGKAATTTPSTPAKDTTDQSKQ